MKIFYNESGLRERVDVLSIFSLSVGIDEISRQDSGSEGIVYRYYIVLYYALK